MMETAPVCMFCGQPEVLGIADIWTDGHFLLETCCGGLLESVSAEMHADPGWGRTLLRRLGAEVLTGARLRRVCDGRGNGPVLDHQLQLVPITFPVARAFIGRHHAHCGPPHCWRFGHGIVNGSLLMGVAAVGNPVARALSGRGIVEVNRLCVRRDVDPMLAWNCCSMLYAHCAREAERRGFQRIITYVREDEDGTSLKAAGWALEGRTRGRGWHSARRARSNRNAWIAKQRWSRALHPKPAERPRLSHPPQEPWFTRPDPCLSFFDDSAINGKLAKLKNGDPAILRAMDIESREA